MTAFGNDIYEIYFNVSLSTTKQPHVLICPTDDRSLGRYQVAFAEIEEWLGANVSAYRINKGSIIDGYNWIMFERDADIVHFKLRWA